MKILFSTLFAPAIEVPFKNQVHFKSSLSMDASQSGIPVSPDDRSPECNLESHLVLQGATAAGCRDLTVIEQGGGDFLM